jgi:uncharacterized membrane protein YbhN (UPF0104 family)
MFRFDFADYSFGFAIVSDFARLCPSRCPIRQRYGHKGGKAASSNTALQQNRARAASSGYISRLAHSQRNETRMELKMIRIGATWLVRVGIATAALAGVGMMANPARKVVSGAAAGAGDATLLHAVALFAIVWLIASLRIRREAGRWRLGFDPLPVRRASAAQTANAGDSRRTDSF